MSFCSKEMKSRIEDDANYDDIKNNPYQLLDEVKKKMYDTRRDKYPNITLTDQLDHILNVIQEDRESLVDYTKIFNKQETMPKDCWEQHS